MLTYRHIGGDGALREPEAYRADVEDKAGAPPEGGRGEYEEDDACRDKERREDCDDQQRLQTRDKGDNWNRLEAPWDTLCCSGRHDRHGLGAPSAPDFNL